MARMVGGSDIGQRFREGEFKSLILVLAPTDPASWRSAMHFGQIQGDNATETRNRPDIIALVREILQQASGETRLEPLRYADIVLDRRRQRAFRGGTAVGLTPTEASLLEYFLENPELVVSKEAILKYVWRRDLGGNTNIVATYVHYLRRKLDAYGPPLIRTVRPAGYILEAKPR